MQEPGEGGACLRSLRPGNKCTLCNVCMAGASDTLGIAGDRHARKPTAQGTRSPGLSDDHALVSLGGEAHTRE